MSFTQQQNNIRNNNYAFIQSNPWIYPTINNYNQAQPSNHFGIHGQPNSLLPFNYNNQSYMNINPPNQFNCTIYPSQNSHNSYNYSLPHHIQASSNVPVPSTTAYINLPKYHYQCESRLKYKIDRTEKQSAMYLIEGYIHKFCVTNINSPLDVVNIMIKYLGNMLIAFDTCPDKYRNIIKENGLLIDKPVHNTIDYGLENAVINLTSATSNYMVGCSNGFDKGYHELKIQVYQKNSLFSPEVFGIISDISYCKLTHIFLQKKDHFYGENYRYLEKDEIITICLDCDNWKVIFKRNGRNVRQMRIEKGFAYFFVIRLNNNARKFKIIT